PSAEREAPLRSRRPSATAPSRLPGSGSANQLCDQHRRTELLALADPQLAASCRRHAPRAFYFCFVRTVEAKTSDSQWWRARALAVAANANDRFVADLLVTGLDV